MCAATSPAQTTRTTCPYCGVGCGVVSGPDGAVRGDIAHPANAGRLCSKGSALGETLGLERRLLFPEIGGRRTTWGEALDLTAAKFSAAVADHGPQSVAMYVSGQFLTEDYYVANKLMKGFIGAANIDTNSRLCMASSVAGHTRAFGEDVVPGCYEDLDEADLVVLVGSNAAWCHPVLFRRLETARARRGTRIVVIDPRRTASCTDADLHLPLRLGSDVALFNGLLVHLAASAALDLTFINAHTRGFDAALAAARAVAPSPGAVAQLTDVNAGLIADFYALFTRTNRIVTLYSQGVNQSSSGTDKVNAIINCHLATGRIGQPGMGPFSLTGQPNAMGGREVGGLANQLAAHMRFDRPAHVDRVRRFWNAPRMATQPGLKAIELFEAILDGKVKALWIAGTNPAVSLPRADRVLDALHRCPFVVVADVKHNDTGEFADVRLPALAWAEKDGTVTNSERCISRQRAFRAPPGEARPDWWMFVEVARRMGFETAFSYSGPADIFREHAALSAFENDGQRLFDIGALADLDDAAYDKLSPTQWPCPRPGPGREAARRLFADGVFPAPDGRARMIPLTINRSSANGDYPLILNTGRIRDQWHTMTRTGRVPHLMTHIAGPWLTLHPSDAAPRGIEDGGLARIESPHGSAVLRTAVDETVRPGNVFVPMHWTDQYSSSGPIDRLVHAATDAVSGQPDLKGTRVQVAAVAEAWRGRLLLLRERDLAPRLGEAVHWFKVPVAAGLGYELSGLTPLAEQISSERDLRILLQVSEEAELISYSDPKKQEFRYAALTGGRLEACVFFAAPRASFPESRQAERRLGETIEPARQFSLLAGAEGDAALAGKTVCACFPLKKVLSAR
jgi:assimilatory nitrate reductase catalytic subunit